MNFFLLISCSIILLTEIKCERKSSPLENLLYQEINQFEDDLSLEEKSRIGFGLFRNAVDVLINGAVDKQDLYKDIFIDTRKSLFGTLHTSDLVDQVTLDEMLRIGLQSVIILIARKNPKFIPDDFGGSFFYIEELRYLFIIFCFYNNNR
jgi:hypothetical protein